MKNLRSSPASLQVRDTRRYGNGVFALSDIPQGHVIHVLTGDTITLDEFVRTVNSGQHRLDDPLQVGAKTFIALDDFSRTFNHCCNPNAGLRKRSELFALRPIRSGEQITYDYSSTIAPTVWRMNCLCGAGNCRKIIGDVRTIPRTQLQRYKALGAIQRYMLAIFAKPQWRRSLPKHELAALEALRSAPKNHRQRKTAK